jgi:hypothetical protein
MTSEPLNRYRHHITNIDQPPIPGGVEGLVETLSVEIDETIQRLVAKASTSAKPDPVVADKFTRISGLVSSAYKRHGLILERAILERLKQCPWFLVWNKKDFRVSAESLADKSGRSIAKYGEAARSLQIDAFVYDINAKSLKAYEVKRGFAYFDSGKRQSIKEELKAIQVLLKSYGHHQNLDVQSWSSHVIFWYGKLSIKEPHGIRGRDSDDHFKWPVFDAIEQVNLMFKHRLDAALTKMVVSG